jgi:hypothetical protein
MVNFYIYPKIHDFYFYLDNNFIYIIIFNPGKMDYTAIKNIINCHACKVFLLQ